MGDAQRQEKYMVVELAAKCQINVAKSVKFSSKAFIQYLREKMPTEYDNLVISEKARIDLGLKIASSEHLGMGICGPTDFYFLSSLSPLPFPLPFTLSILLSPCLPFFPSWATLLTMIFS